MPHRTNLRKANIKLKPSLQNNNSNKKDMIAFPYMMARRYKKKALLRKIAHRNVTLERVKNV